MGASGAKAFDNDDAMDWLSELSASADDSVLSQAFDAVLSAEYVEVPEASVAIAAAEVVAGAVDAPGRSVPPEVAAWIQAHGSTVTPATTIKAQEATTRVATDSELNELWTDSPSANFWREEIVDLQRRLAGATE